MQLTADSDIVLCGIDLSPVEYHVQLVARETGRDLAVVTILLPTTTATDRTSNRRARPFGPHLLLLLQRRLKREVLARGCQFGMLACRRRALVHDLDSSPLMRQWPRRLVRIRVL